MTEHAGRGYNGYSKSNNAISAEAEGKMNASQLGKALGVSAKIIRGHCTVCEYHHASKFYTSVDYYDEWKLVAVAEALKAGKGWERWREIVGNIGKAEVRKTIVLLAKMWAESNVKTAEHKVIANFKWLEWSGTRRRPMATEVKHESVPATLKGDYAIIETKGGIVRKLTTGKHFDMHVLSELE